MSERKLVVVKDNVILHELGGIGGPILTPTRITIDAILKMINNKRHVFECYPNDPRNESLWVELTNANYKSNNFNKAASDEKIPEEHKEVQEPVNSKDEIQNNQDSTPVDPEVPTTDVDASNDDGVISENENEDVHQDSTPVDPEVPTTDVDVSNDESVPQETPVKETKTSNSNKKNKKNK